MLLQWLWPMGVLQQSSHVLAATVYVSPTGVDQLSCGQSPSTACGSLGYAITAISSPQDNTIELADGMYQELGPVIEFSSAAIAHNLTVHGATGATSVAIDRMYTGRLFVFAIGAKSVTFERLRFLRGGWGDTSSNVADYSGAFMRFVSSDINQQISFTHCDFESHRNPARGYSGRGAVAAIASGSPTFRHCRFHDNWGGIAGTLHIHGHAKPVFEHCTFENSGCFHDGWGGVVVPEGQSSPVWRHCVFRNNTCDYGGAVDDGGTATPRFEDCVFEYNWSRGLGGAYYGFGESRSVFEGCVFRSNGVSKGGNGQDFYLSSSSFATFDKCSFDAGDSAVTIADGACGNVRDNSTLVMRASTVQRYRATKGVFIVNVDARATFESSTFQDNSCIRGGVVVTDRPTTFANCTFQRNSAVEGGVLLFFNRLPMWFTIQDCHFRDNVATTSGGAIKIIGPGSLHIEHTTFTNNSAQSVGGGAIYVMADGELTVNASTFEANTANVGGAIWCEGKLVVESSLFVENALLASDSDGQSDACGMAAGTGGAIYAALPTTRVAVQVENSGGEGGCTVLSQYLHLKRNTFQRNSAGKSGAGGAVFLDKAVPTCVRTLEQICVDCTFTANTAAYGDSIATIARALVLKNSTTLQSWELMTPVDLVVGAVDALGQELTGAHAVLNVRVTLTSSSQQSFVSLTTNASRGLRNGDAHFKSLALQLPVTSLNNADLPLNLTFSSDLASIGGPSERLDLVVPLTLLKCGNEKGLIRSPDGKCLVEAKSDRQRLIAAIVLSFVLSAGLAFGLYWSYRHSSRVLETLHRLATGVGASIARLVFELLDVVSDVQALVNLFVFDANLINLLYVRAAYVTLFAISLPPSIAVMKATLENVAVQWKRMGSSGSRSRAVVAHHDSVGGGGSGGGGSAKGAQGKPMGAAQHEQLTSPVVPILPSLAAVVHHPSGSPGGMVDWDWDIHAIQAHLTRQVKTLELDLEYHRARSKYMQRVLVRLVTEDILLFVLNLYIYWRNQSDSVFLQSRFRSSLEFSILMSAMHFGAQVQNVVLWLHHNKVGEIRRQLLVLEQLRQRRS